MRKVNLQSFTFNQITSLKVSDSIVSIISEGPIQICGDATAMIDFK